VRRAFSLKRTSTFGAAVVIVRRGAWLGGLLALAACLAVLSVVSLIRTYLDIKFAGDAGPFERAVSYHVFVEDGRRAFAVSVIVVAVASITLLAGMARVGVRLRTSATILFGVWCVSLTLCAIFPKDNGKAIDSAAGAVHLVAGAARFISLPLAGRALAALLQVHGQWARTAGTARTLGAAAIMVAAYPIARLLPVIPGVSGLIPRVLFVLESGLLLVLATRLLRVSTR
jgi:hypothetical protein